MGVQIRLMQAQDYDQAIQLWQSLPGLGLSGADSPKAIQAFLQHNPQTCLVAEQDNQVIGTVLGGSDGRRGYLYHLAVEAQVQKQGVGKTLVRACLDALQAQGIQKCHIFVYADNQEGQKFWQKTGWVQRNELLVMSKDIST